DVHGLAEQVPPVAQRLNERGPRTVVPLSGPQATGLAGGRGLDSEQPRDPRSPASALDEEILLLSHHVAETRFGGPPAGAPRNELAAHERHWLARGDREVGKGEPE